MFGKFAVSNFFVFLSLFSLSASAQSSVAAKNQSKNQVGIVISPEAAVYSSADFDSEVIGQLQENQKVPMSNKRFKSKTDFGAFFKVKMPNGKIGYVADNDIQPLRLKKKMDEEMGPADDDSLYFKKMVGGSLATVNFSEKFQGKTSSAQTTMFGFRVSGPDILGDSPPLDLNILVGIKPPSYYDGMSSGASGFFLLGDVGLIFPLMDWTKSMLNFGAGLMWTYTHFSVPINGKTYTSDELRLGIDLSFGGAIRFDQLVIRGDVKYFIEKTQYSGLMLSLQKLY